MYFNFSQNSNNNHHPPVEDPCFRALIFSTFLFILTLNSIPDLSLSLSLSVVKLHLSVSQVCEAGQAQLQMFAVTDSIPAGSHPSPSFPLFLPSHHTLSLFLLLLLPDPVL